MSLTRFSFLHANAVALAISWMVGWAQDGTGLIFSARQTGPATSRLYSLSSVQDPTLWIPLVKKLGIESPVGVRCMSGPPFSLQITICFPKRLRLNMLNKIIMMKSCYMYTIKSFTPNHHSQKPIASHNFIILMVLKMINQRKRFVLINKRFPKYLGHSYDIIRYGDMSNM